MRNTANSFLHRASYALTWFAAAASCAAAGDQTSVYLNVETAKGFVIGLQPENFRVYLDGKLHPFSLAPRKARPLSPSWPSTAPHPATFWKIAMWPSGA